MVEVVGGVGGVVWLTTLHSIAEQNQINIEKIQMEMDADKTRIYSRLNELDQKMSDLSTLLGRMEGKLDMIVQRREK